MSDAFFMLVYGECLTGIFFFSSLFTVFPRVSIAEVNTVTKSNLKRRDFPVSMS